MCPPPAQSVKLKMLNSKIILREVFFKCLDPKNMLLEVFFVLKLAISLVSLGGGGS